MVTFETPTFVYTQAIFGLASALTLRCPILAHQTRDALGVLHIARDEGSALGEGEGSNAQSHGANAESHGPQLLVLRNGWLCKGRAAPCADTVAPECTGATEEHHSLHKAS